MDRDDDDHDARTPGRRRLRMIESCRVQASHAAMVVALGTIPDTSHWVVAVWSDPEQPLLVERGGLALRIEKVRYDEPRARALYARVLRALELADIARLRKTCRPQERLDDFFCWAFGLVSSEEAREIQEINDASAALARARDRGELSQDEFLREHARITRAIRLRHAWSGGKGRG